MTADGRRALGEEVVIPVSGGELTATVNRPAEPRGVVLFAHGSGSSRHSPRNQWVASLLTDAGYTTVLLDLLTPAEDAADQLTAQWRFDTELLATRLTQTADWLARQSETGEVPLGLFGASTGAAAALMTAAQRPDTVRAVVSRGGRPDLAGTALSGVRAATLLIVGGLDDVVIDLNRRAAADMGGHASLVIVDGASHLFTEPGTLAQVAELAVTWYHRHLTAAPTADRPPPM